MVENKTYSYDEFRKALAESAWSQNKPQIDPAVIKTDAQNNVSAVDDILKQVSEYDKTEREERNAPPQNSVDLNKSLLDLNYTVEPSDKFKQRVMAQVKGFPSVENEKTTDAKNNESLDYKGNEEFLKAVEDRKKQEDELNTDVKHAGLTARELDRDNFKPNTIFKESKENKNKMKRLHFKKAFLNEEDALSRIPEDFKKDGDRFYMKDCNGNEFLVECKEDTYVKGYIHTNIVSASNPQRMDEMFARMEQLTNYDSSDYFRSTQQEVESGMFTEMLDCTRKMKGSAMND